MTTEMNMDILELCQSKDDLGLKMDHRDSVMLTALAIISAQLQQLHDFEVLKMEEQNDTKITLGEIHQRLFEIRNK